MIQSPPTKPKAGTESGNNQQRTKIKSQGASVNNRSSSQPKQRGKNVNKSSSAGSSGYKSQPPVLSAYETALAKMKKNAAGKTDEELEAYLKLLLQSGAYKDAAYLIAGSSYLDAKFKTSDVVRLMLEGKQFDNTAQLIRDMKMQNNQLLVTLFIKELVRYSLFHAAVRYAQEFVQNFGKTDFGPREQSRPSWTPQALVQAMIRAQQYRTALKFAKQFDLLETFPAVPLIANMFEARCWEEAISSVMEFRLFTEFPIEALIMKMLEQRQWSLAVKCMNKLQSVELMTKYSEALVKEAARVGDFVSAVKYLREFKLDDVENNTDLLQYLVDAMIKYQEFYKAIKYSIKFELGLSTENNEATSSDDIRARYNTNTLILQAMQCGQYHVATTYIKKLKLKDAFAKELAEMEKLQQQRLLEFRQYIQLRQAQFDHPSSQQQLHALLGNRLEDDSELVSLEPIMVDVIISVEEEIIPRKQKQKQEADEDDDAGDDVILMNLTQVHQEPLNEKRVEEIKPGDSDSLTQQVQSRFDFARSTSPSTPIEAQSASTSQSFQGSGPPAPPGLNIPIKVQDQSQQYGADQAEQSSGGFQFAEFAKAVQISSGTSLGVQPPLPAPQLLSSSAASLAMQFQSQVPSHPPPPPSFYADRFALPQNSESTNYHQPSQPFVQQQQQHHHQMTLSGYNGAPLPVRSGSINNQAPPMPGYPAPPMYHQQMNFAPNMTNGHTTQHQASNYMQAPLRQQDQQTVNGGERFDIASLAMQFHNSGSSVNSGLGARGFGFNNNSPFNSNQAAPGPYPGGHANLFLSFASPPRPFATAPPSSFKPSIGYTSVTTTRQKK